MGEKAAKEVAYHLDHAHQWVMRLGDGTEESHHRMQRPSRPYSLIGRAVRRRPRHLAAAEAGVGVLPSSLHDAVVTPCGRIVERGHAHPPERLALALARRGQGVHSAPMGYLLAEMQHVARSHPGATW